MHQNSLLLPIFWALLHCLYHHPSTAQGHLQTIHIVKDVVVDVVLCCDSRYITLLFTQAIFKQFVEVPRFPLIIIIVYIAGFDLQQLICIFLSNDMLEVRSYLIASNWSSQRALWLEPLNWRLELHLNHYQVIYFKQLTTKSLQC